MKVVASPAQLDADDALALILAVAKRIFAFLDVGYRPIRLWPFCCCEGMLKVLAAIYEATVRRVCTPWLSADYWMLHQE